MIITPQKKGKSHIAYINEIAISYWAKLDFKRGCYAQCLRDAMKEHRDYLIACLKKRRNINQEHKREFQCRCEDCFTPLEQNDIFHYGMRCHGCFQERFADNYRESGMPIPVPPRILNYR